MRKRLYLKKIWQQTWVKNNISVFEILLFVLILFFQCLIPHKAHKRYYNIINDRAWSCFWTQIFKKTHSKTTLDYPELLQQRAVLQAFNVFDGLVHYGELAKIWKEEEPNHSGETREKDLQSCDVTPLLCYFIIWYAINQTLEVRERWQSINSKVIEQT